MSKLSALTVRCSRGPPIYFSDIRPRASGGLSVPDIWRQPHTIPAQKNLGLSFNPASALSAVRESGGYHRRKDIPQDCYVCAGTSNAANCHVLHDDRGIDLKLARAPLSAVRPPASLYSPWFRKMMKKRVNTTKRECIKEAKRIEALADLGHASIVLPSILRCIVRQLDMALYDNLPVEVQATACRILFELRDHTKLMVTKPARISKFLAERWFNELEALTLMNQLRPAESIRKRLEKVKGQIQSMGLKPELRRMGLKPEPGGSYKSRAELNGNKKEYETFYRLLCLYVHATGMLAAEEYQTCYRMGFIQRAEMYARDCLLNVRDCVANLQIGTNAGLKHVTN